MSKRKFNIKSLFSGRANKATRTSENGEPAGWPSDSESDDHFDPAAVNRPPPLDDRTEARLREACAIIVENLKPSGYDIEDTRMKNDIYVDDLSDQEEPPVTIIQPDYAKQYKQPTTWFEDGSDRNSSILNHHDVHDSSEKRRSATLAERESYHAKRRSEHQRVSKMLKAQQENTSEPQPYQIESPIAPAATARRRSRVDIVPQMSSHASEPTRQTSGVRNASSSTMSTQYTASTNGVPSVSTGITSAAHTPASTSKRTSEHTRTDYPPSAPDADAAGAWMKEEVDKRKQVESNGSAHHKGYESGVTVDTVQSVDEYQQAHAVSIVYSRASNMTSPTRERSDGSRSQSASTSSPPSKPRRNVRDDDDTTTASPPQHEFDYPVQAPPRRPSSDYGDEDASDREDTVPHDLPSSPPQTAPQTAPNPPQSPQQNLSKPAASSPTDAFDKTMANIRARMAATSLSSHPVNLSQPTSPGPEPDFKRHPAFSASRISNGGDLSQGRRQASQPSVPNRSSASYNQVPQMPPMPGKHQLEGSVIVKDFAGASTERARRAQNDVDAVGFDSFMNVVDQVNTPTSPSFSSRHRTPPVAPPEPPRVTSPKSDTGTRPRSALSMNGGSRPKSPRSAVSFAAGTAGPKSFAASQASSEQPPQSPPRFNLISPPIPPTPSQLPASLERRYSPITTEPPKTATSLGPQNRHEPISPSSTERPQNTISAFDFLRSQNIHAPGRSIRQTPALRSEPNLSALPPQQSKSDFIRVEAHPAYASTTSVANSTNGINGHQTNGSINSNTNYSNYSHFPSNMPNGTTTSKDPTTDTSSTTSNPTNPNKSAKSIKSPSRLSISSGASSRNQTNTYHQTAPLPPPPAPVQQKPVRTTTPSKSTNTTTLKSWLSRRRSRSFISTSPRSNAMNPYMNGGAFGYTFADAVPNGRLPGKSVNGNSTWGDGGGSFSSSGGMGGGFGSGGMGSNNPMGGFAYYHASQDQDEEYEDPLVCAAPVVAFGRGW